MVCGIDLVARVWKTSCLPGSACGVRSRKFIGARNLILRCHFMLLE